MTDINIKLFDISGAQDGDVLAYVASNGYVEFKAIASAADVETRVSANINLVQDNVAALDNNAWVNSNDYATYTVVTANIYNTYTTLLSYVDGEVANLVNGAPASLDTLNELAAALGNDANLSVTLLNAIGTVSDNAATNAGNIDNIQSNLTTLESTVDANTYNTYVTLQGNIDTVQDNVAALDNNAWVNANDYATYSTLTSLINTVNSNVDALPDSAANDYNTYTTVTSLIDTVQSNVDSLTSTVDNIDANVYNTYNALSGFIDTVQDNVAAGTSTNVTIFTASDLFTVSTSNTFNLSRTVNNARDIFVSISGVTQYPGVGYTVSDNVLNISNTAPLKQGLEIEARHLIGESGIRGNSWQEISTSSLLNARSRVIVDTSSSAIVLTLPNSPILGDEVRIIDGVGNASNNAITLFGNGANIEADSSNVVIDIDRSAFTLVYYNAYQGWVFGEK